MTRLIILFCGAICFFCQHPLRAQNLSNTNKDPFTASGNIGASANFYTSNESVSSRPHFSWNTNGNFVLSKRNFSLPVSFIVTQFSNRKTYTYSQFGISPTYKWATLYLGDRYVYFSPFTFQGQSFRGVGLDLKPGIFRFTAFYGRINKAIDEDTSRLQYQPLQYSRTGYGIKIGVGNTNNFFDLSFFHAKDDTTSAHSNTNNPSLSKVPALENSVLGASFKFRILKKISITGDMAASGLTQDIGFKAVDTKFIDSSVLPNSGFIKSLYHSANDHLMVLNSSSIFSYAGQSSLSFNSRFFNSSLHYRRVAPDFITLGTPYLIDDVELASLLNTLSAFKGKLNVSASLSEQHNNLNKNKNAELHAWVGTINVNTMLSTHFNVNVNYSGYDLINKEGAVHISDALRNTYPLLKQQISQFSFSPTYNFAKGYTIQVISGNINLSDLKNKTPTTFAYVTTNNKNLSASLTYNLGFINKPLNFSLNTLYNQFRADSLLYVSYGATLGASVQFLKKKNLTVQGNIGMFLNHYDPERQHNFTYSINVGYREKHHSFSMYGNYVLTPYNNAISNAIKQATFSYSVTTKNLAGGISYNYSF